MTNDNPTSKPTRDTVRKFREQALEIIGASLDEARTQHPLDIPQIFEYDRPTLGGKVPIELYRAIRLLAFREVVGSKISAAILGVCGRSIAQKLSIRSESELTRTLEDLAIGRMTIDEQSDDGLVISTTECVTCSGAPNVGEPLCYFEAGLIAGGLENVMGSVKVVETQCWGLGQRICRWEARRDTPHHANGEDSIDQLEVLMTLAGRAASAVDNAVAIRQKNRQLREAYNQLRESERLRNDLTDMVVHDMRVPLTAVIGSMQTLAEMMESKLSSTESEVLNTALSSGNMLLRMINDILDVSKLEGRKVSLRKRPTAVAELVEQAVSHVKILASRKRLRLNTSVLPDLPNVPVDRERTVRVLINLLANAIHHSSSGGKVSIAATLGEGSKMVEFRVDDTGIGIPKEYHKRIFDKFVQVESAKRRKPSSGLGLTFCKLVVEAHGGQIWVESEPEQGSTFFFTLPTGD